MVRNAPSPIQATAADLASEILGIHDAMKSRTTAVSGAPDRSKRDSLELKYATSIAAKISNLPFLSMAHASELYSAIKAAELNSTASALLTTAVDSALETAADEDYGDKVTPPSQKNQMLLFPLVYMTAALIDSLQSRMSVDTKILLVAEFLVKLGSILICSDVVRAWKE